MFISSASVQETWSALGCSRTVPTYGFYVYSADIPTAYSLRWSTLGTRYVEIGHYVADANHCCKMGLKCLTFEVARETAKSTSARVRLTQWRDTAHQCIHSLATVDRRDWSMQVTGRECLPEAETG